MDNHTQMFLWPPDLEHVGLKFISTPRGTPREVEMIQRTCNSPPDVHRVALLVILLGPFQLFGSGIKTCQAGNGELPPFFREPGLSV